jgi:hypothetical protein
VLTYCGRSRSATYTFLASSDGVKWWTLSAALSSGRWGDFETFDVPDASARYVRIVCGGTTVNDLDGIYEVRIY